MIIELKNSLWKQFGASIDTLEETIKLCPDNLLMANSRFFYMTFHVLIFLDYYLTIPPSNFSPALPFTPGDGRDIPENAIDDLIPDRHYSKKELLDYLRVSREKCRKLITSLTEEKIVSGRFVEEAETDAMNYSILEILLYNMRHVQHHAAQMNLLLRQEINDASGWVFEVKDNL
jgi:hypothetical protein